MWPVRSPSDHGAQARSVQSAQARPRANQKIYFNEKGRAKIEIALARGKQLHDKRETEKARDWNREKGRLLREKG